MLSENNIARRTMNALRMGLFVLLPKIPKIVMHFAGHLRLVKVLKPFKDARLIHLSTYVMYTYNYVSTSINTAERLSIETYNYTFLKTVFNAGLLNRIFKEGVECWSENDGVNSLSVIFSFSSYE